MPDDSLKPSHPEVPSGTLPADRLLTVLRRLDAGFYQTPAVLEVVARRILADLNPSAPDAPPDR